MESVGRKGFTGQVGRNLGRGHAAIQENGVPGEGIRRDPTPPPLFWQKRLQAVENKGSECEKESQEKTRGGKSMKIKGKRPFAINALGEPFAISALGKGELQRGRH